MSLADTWTAQGERWNPSGWWAQLTPAEHWAILLLAAALLLFAGWAFGTLRTAHRVQAQYARHRHPPGASHRRDEPIATSLLSPASGRHTGPLPVVPARPGPMP